HVQAAVVLHIGLFADADIMHIAADRSVRPDAGPLAHDDVTNHLSAGIDIGGRGDFRLDAAIATNRHSDLSILAWRKGWLIGSRLAGPSGNPLRLRASAV